MPLLQPKWKSAWIMGNPLWDLGFLRLCKWKILLECRMWRCRNVLCRLWVQFTQDVNWDGINYTFVPVQLSLDGICDLSALYLPSFITSLTFFSPSSLSFSFSLSSSSHLSVCTGKYSEKVFYLFQPLLQTYFLKIFTAQRRSQGTAAVYLCVPMGARVRAWSSMCTLLRACPARKGSLPDDLWY